MRDETERGEPEMRLMRIFLLFFVFTLAGSLSAEDGLPVTRSICLLKSEQGRGSGFFASFAGMDVVFTNNHVILGMEDVRIYDINGHEYAYDKIYSSPERDLAVIPVQRTNHATMPNLKISGNPDMLHPGANVSAYGDSLGDGVIVEVKGSFQGIGPQTIEVSSPFVPGNSGGPVVEKESRTVIGVATYCRIIRGNSETLTGSRFASKSSYKPAVRRFATRIDNVTPDDFELVTKEQVKEDQEKYRPFARAYDFIMESLRGPNIFTARERIIEYFKTHSQFETGGKWHTTYLKKDAMEKWTFIKNILDFLRSDASFSPQNVESVSEKEDIRHIWREYSSSITVKKKKPVTMKCPACDGAGKVKEKLSEYEIKMNAKKMRPTYKMVVCDVCRGKQTFTFCGDDEYFVAPPPFFDKMAEKIRPMPKKVMGFGIGGAVSDLETVFNGFYSKKKRKISRTGIFTVYSYRGNHKDKDAAETRLWFMGGILMRIDLFYPVRDRSFIETVFQDLVRDFGEDMPFYFNVIRKTLTGDEIRQSFQKRGRNGMLVEHVKIAYKNDPFGVYCLPGKNQIRKICFYDDYGGVYYDKNGAAYHTEEPLYICVSFIHALFETCSDLRPPKRQGGRFD